MDSLTTSLIATRVPVLILKNVTAVSQQDGCKSQSSFNFTSLTH